MMNENDEKRFRKAVERLNREYADTLHGIRCYNDPEKQFVLACFEYRKYLGKIINLLNGITPDKKVKNIVDVSCLEWKKPNASYSVDSEIFRARFLTLLLTELSSHIAELCDKEYQARRQDNGIYEQAYFYMLDIRERLNRFTTLFMTGNDWRDLILTIAEFTYLIRVDSKKRVGKLINGTNRLVRELRKGASKDGMGGSVDEAILVQFLFQLAELMCGGYTENPPMPRFKSFSRKTPGVDNYQYEIAYVGKAILYSPEAKRKTSLLFQIYKDASPKTTSRFREIGLNMYLQTGVMALSFVNFILNDKNCDDLVRRLLNNKEDRWVW